MVIWVERDKMIKKTRGLWEEFKSFAVKGNAFELAIAVVIGSASATADALVRSWVSETAMPAMRAWSRTRLAFVLYATCGAP